MTTVDSTDKKIFHVRTGRSFWDLEVSLRLKHGVTSVHVDCRCECSLYESLPSSHVGRPLPSITATWLIGDATISRFCVLWPRQAFPWASLLPDLYVLPTSTPKMLQTSTPLGLWEPVCFTHTENIIFSLQVRQVDHGWWWRWRRWGLIVL